MNFFEKAQARAHAQEVLGLTGHPDPDEIRAAYKKLAREKHPDRCEGTQDEFARINVAYSLLKKDKGYTAADMLHPTPTDVGATTFRPKARRPDSAPVSDISGDKDNIAGTYVAPRRMRTAMTSRIIKISQSDSGECRTLLDEPRSVALAKVSLHAARRCATQLPESGRSCRVKCHRPEPVIRRRRTAGPSCGLSRHTVE